jgi:hypothetical protein
MKKQMQVHMQIRSVTEDSSVTALDYDKEDTNDR